MNIKEFNTEYEAYLESLLKKKSLSYSTVKNRKTLLRYLEKILLDDISQLSVKHIDSITETMRGEGNKGQTVNQKVGRLKMIFDYAVERGYIKANPLDTWEPMGMDDINHRRDLTPDEIARLLDVANQEYRCRYAVFLYTGLRAENATNICWSWIDMQNDVITIPLTEYKTREDIQIPLHPNLKEILLTFKRGYDSDPIFPKKHIESVRRMLLRDCKRAGIDTDGVDLHALRHTFASVLYAGGVRLEVISKLLGHKNISTTQRYLHYDKKTLREGIMQLPY